MKMPAFQFYPADWRKDPGVQALDFHDRGVWFEILCIMHESDERGVLLLNGRPMPEPALARMLGLDNQILTTTLTNLVTYGVASRRESDGALVSRRMVKDEALCQVRREAGKKGGNPNLVNQKPNQKPTTRDNQKPTPSSSTSSSTSSSEDEGASAPEPSPLKAETGGQKLVGSANPARETALAVGDGDGELRWDESPLTKPHGFQAICEGNGYPGIDYEHYRKQALDAAKNESPQRPRTSPQWRSWVRKYLNYESKGGPLLQPQVLMPTVPTPKHELPQPGQERQGQVIAIQGVPGDQNMNRMLVATYQKQFPTATIHAIVPRTS